MGELSLNFIETQIDATQGSSKAFPDTGFVGSQTLAKVFKDSLERRQHQCIGDSGFQTPFELLNQKILGLQPGQLIVLGGRTTAPNLEFMLNLISHSLDERAGKTLVCSTQADAPTFISYLLSIASSICIKRLLRGNISKQELQRIDELRGKLASRDRLFVDTNKTPSIDSINSGFELIAPQKPSVLFIDNLSNLRLEDTRPNTREDVEIVLEILKQMAIELNIPIVIGVSGFCHVAVELNYRTVLADLRHVDLIDRFADIVLLMHVNETVRATSLTRKECELWVEKSVIPELGRVPLSFDASNLTFSESKRTTHTFTRKNRR